MRTTVDIDERLLKKARQIAAENQRTLGAVLSDALAGYLATRETAAEQPPFELLVRGRAGGRFPTPAEFEELADEEDAAALGVVVRQGRNVSP
jgi:predicted transcriptional regulator